MFDKCLCADSKVLFHSLCNSSIRGVRSAEARGGNCAYSDVVKKALGSKSGREAAGVSVFVMIHKRPTICEVPLIFGIELNC